MVGTTWASGARLSQRANVEHAQTERETTIMVDSRGTLQDAEETAQTELRPHREIFERQLFPKNRGRVARFQMLRCHSHTVSSGLLRPFLPWPSNRSPDSLFQLYGSLGGGSTHCPAAGGPFGKPVLFHRVFASASLPSLTRGISLSPSRLRSKTHAGVTAPDFPSLVDLESGGPVVVRRRGRWELEERSSFSPLCRHLGRRRSPRRKSPATRLLPPRSRPDTPDLCQTPQTFSQQLPAAL
jgi:hypothetical protein